MRNHILGTRKVGSTLHAPAARSGFICSSFSVISGLSRCRASPQFEVAPRFRLSSPRFVSFSRLYYIRPSPGEAVASLPLSFPLLSPRPLTPDASLTGAPALEPRLTRLPHTPLSQLPDQVFHPISLPDGISSAHPSFLSSPNGALVLHPIFALLAFSSPTVTFCLFACSFVSALFCYTAHRCEKRKRKSKKCNSP